MADEFWIAPTSNQSVLPKREEHSVGYDVFAYGDHVISPGETKIIPLGFIAAMPDEYVGRMCDRSSMGAKGLHVYGGVLDGSYRGQWAVILHSTRKEIYAINHGDKIAQFLIQKCELPELEIGNYDFVSAIPSERGAAGLGSTDGQHTAESAQAAIAAAATAEEFPETEDEDEDKGEGE